MGVGAGSGSGDLGVRIGSVAGPGDGSSLGLASDTSEVTRGGASTTGDGSYGSTSRTTTAGRDPADVGSSPTRSAHSSSALSCRTSSWRSSAMIPLAFSDDRREAIKHERRCVGLGPGSE